MTIEYVHTGPFDFVAKGQIFRLVLNRGSTLMRAATFIFNDSFASLYDALTKLTAGQVFPVSPKPADAADAAVIDVKVAQSATVTTIGELASRINSARTAIFLTRVELLDQHELSQQAANEARRSLIEEDTKHQHAKDPFADLFGGVRKAALVLVILVGVGAGIAIYRNLRTK